MKKHTKHPYSKIDNRPVQVKINHEYKFNITNNLTMQITSLHNKFYQVESNDQLFLYILKFARSMFAKYKNYIAPINLENFNVKLEETNTLVLENFEIVKKQKYYQELEKDLLSFYNSNYEFDDKDNSKKKIKRIKIKNYFDINCSKEFIIHSLFQLLDISLFAYMSIYCVFIQYSMTRDIFHNILNDKYVVNVFDLFDVNSTYLNESTPFDEYLIYIIPIINIYENHKINNKFLVTTKELLYDDISNNVNYIISYPTLQSVIWDNLKLFHPTAYNGDTFFINLCTCGLPIEDQSPRCVYCKKLHVKEKNRRNKRNERCRNMTEKKQK